MKYLQLNKILLALIILFSSVICNGQTYPFSEGERAKFNFKIELQKAYLSGILVLLNEDNSIKASVVNEFGISALDFVYDAQKDRIYIESIIKKMDKWYIKKVLKKDLAMVVKAIKRDETKYENIKNKITYLFTPLCN